MADKAAELAAVADRIVGQQHKVNEAQSMLDEYKGSAREWRQLLDKRRITLNDLIQTFERLRDGDSITLGSLVASELPTVPVDVGGMAGLGVLKIAAGAIEKLAERDVRTVRELEKFMADGHLVHGSIKGIGDKSIDKIHDALEIYRRENPLVVEPEPEIATVSDWRDTLSTDGIDMAVVA